MTLDSIRELLTGVDPDIRHHWHMGDGSPYTYWEETQRLSLMADDRHQEGWKFCVHRFTKDEDDDIARSLFDTLDGDPRVTVKYLVDYEPDTDYIHHIYDCEGY